MVCSSAVLWSCFFVRLGDGESQVVCDGQIWRGIRLDKRNIPRKHGTQLSGDRTLDNCSPVPRLERRFSEVVASAVAFRFTRRRL
ncbi:hypothetical protein J3A83DRAFT_3815689 [Scleroderma citrinum]